MRQRADVLHHSVGINEGIDVVVGVGAAGDLAAGVDGGGACSRDRPACQVRHRAIAEQNGRKFLALEGSLADDLAAVIDAVCIAFACADQGAQVLHDSVAVDEGMFQAGGGLRIADDDAVVIDPDAVLLVPPGSTPRSYIVPLLYKNACWLPPAVDELPMTWPLLLMPVARLIVPPGNVPRSVIV